jgi:hypothetical protein
VFLLTKCFQVDIADIPLILEIHDLEPVDINDSQMVDSKPKISLITLCKVPLVIAKPAALVLGGTFR